MQITDSVVCDTSKGSLYKQIKPPLVGEHAFPLTGFVCQKAHVTFGDSGGIRSTARPELPYPCNLVGAKSHPICCVSNMIFIILSKLTY